MVEVHQQFKGVFPKETHIIEIKGAPNEFEASLRCQCKNKEEFINWLKQYQELSKLTFRVSVTRPTTGKTVLYKAVYRCHHNTYPNSHKRVKRPHDKNTDCPALLRVTVKSSVANRRVRSADKLRSDFPTIIKVIHKHNHKIMVAEALKFRDMSENVKLKLTDMFKKHYPPARALEILKQDLLKEFGDDYYKISADSSLCPDIKTVYQLYYSVLRKEFGGQKASINEILEEIVKKTQQHTKLVFEINGNDFVLVAIPVLMQRVHDIALSMETVFIESSGNMDQFNCNVFLLFTDSPVGKLPLGFFLTSSENEETIATALNLLKEILPEKCFGGSLTQQPAVFVIDDGQAKINAIRKVFPNSAIYLNTFHILHSLWRWLLESSDNINICDRLYIFKLFKKTVCSVDEEAFQNHCNNFLQDEIIKRYPTLIIYMKKQFDNSAMWSHSYRKIFRNINNSNPVDNAMKIIKDNILNRTKTYNPVQLYKFIETDLCNYYTRKIGDIINGKYNGQQQPLYFPKNTDLKDLKVNCEGDNLFTVKNIKLRKEYQVNLELGLCSCSVGKKISFCKHQNIASLQTEQKYNDNVISISEEDREYYHWIAYGTRVQENWYDSLMPSNSTCDSLMPSTSTSPSIFEGGEDQDLHKTCNSISPVTSNNIFESDWIALHNRIGSLMEKCKNGPNSMSYYQGWEKAINFLENVKTDHAAITALHSIGKQIKDRRKVICGGNKCLQSDLPLTDHLYSKKEREK